MVKKTALTSITLVPITFRMVISVGKEPAMIGDAIFLRGEVGLLRRESVKLTTEENFNELDGVLELLEQEDGAPTDENTIGWLHYFEKLEDWDVHEKAKYVVEVKLPKRQFEALVIAVSQGKLPSEILIETEGMSYDVQPDGRGKVWDNKTSPRLPIKSISFTTPLIGGDPNDSWDDRSPEDGMPPSRSQLNQVTTVLNELKNKLDSIHSKLYWLVIILLIAMLAVLLWSFFG
jgi:hypothetical protein